MDTQDIIRDFVAKWSLDAGSSEMLHTLPDEVLKNVVEAFNPPSDTRNLDAKLKVFVQKGYPLTRTSLDASSGGIKARRPPSDTRSLDASLSAGIKEFSEKWQLDEAATKLLEELDPEFCANVLVEFDPPPDTQNINARLQSFVKSRAKGASHGGMHDAVADFVATWGLDTASEALLRSLPMAVLHAVFQEFNPKPGTFNLSGKLTAFVRNIERRINERGSAGSPSNGSYNHHSSDVISRFARQWGLDAAAEHAVRELPVHAQKAVIGEFNPPPGTVNASGKLMAFIRRTAGASSRTHSFSDPVAEFIGHWQLDAAADQLLRSLPYDVQEDMMQTFQPHADTRNFSARFQTFVQARLAQLNHPGQGMTRKRPYEDTRSDGGLDGRIAKQHGDDRISGFVQQWGLDERSESLLSSLSEDVLIEVLSNFKPEENTRNPNAKLATWIKALQNGGPSAKERHEGLSADVASFVCQWRLDEKSESLLHSLSERVLVRVMKEFQPEENTRNMNAKLASWIRTMSDGGDQPARKWARTYY